MLLGTKLGMTQLFTDEGRCVPATILQADPATVLRVKTSDTDGYDSIQIGYGSQKEHRLNKARKGEVGDKNFRGLKEFRTENKDNVPSEGDTLSVEQFTIGQNITVSALSKAKGFQGVVKRHGFSGSNKTHGQKHTLRAPGSIGATGPQRVFKGLKMGGRTGGKRITVKNLTVAQIDADKNLLYVEGAVPGRKGTMVEIVAAPLLKEKQS